MAHSRIKLMLGNAVGSTSSGTSPSIFVGDCRLLSVSIQTSTTSASNVSIDLSNDDGFTGAVVNWSTVTVLPQAGIFAIDPGARWVRAQRANIAMTSAASMSTVILNRYYE